MYVRAHALGLLPTAPKPSAANLALLGVGLLFAFWVLKPKKGRR